jgi:hypothetical protein
MAPPAKPPAAPAPSPLAVMANLEAANHVRTWATIAFACAAGIAGLTGGAGFALYLLQHVVVAAALLQRSGWAPGRYFPGASVLGFAATGLGDLSNILTFILFWTLSFALVHIF